MGFRYLNESEIKWLKNRRNDRRPEVQELARQVFDMKFPRQARNENIVTIKQMTQQKK